MSFTEYKLFRELIDGNIFVSEEETGKFNMQITTDSSTIEGYEDITSTATIQDWINCCDRNDLDYKYKRRVIKTIYGLSDNETWDSYSNNIKYITSSIKATSLNRCLEILDEDSDLILAQFDLDSIKCRQIRLARAKSMLLNNIDQVSAFTILNRVQADQLDRLYTSIGVEGTQDQDAIEGLFNFIESTPLSAYGGTLTDPFGRPLGKYEIIGLATTNMIMLGNLTQSQLVTKIINCLRYGIY